MRREQEREEGTGGGRGNKKGRKGEGKRNGRGRKGEGRRNRRGRREQEEERGYLMSATFSPIFDL